MTMEMIFSGFGGQGVLTAGLIVIHAGAALDKQVLWSPSYGSEMRGGTANCSVTISDDEIGSPQLTALDALVAMNEPSLDKFAGLVRPGKLILVNSSIVGGDYAYPDGVAVCRVAATELAGEMGNPRGTNLVMLGALLRRTGLFELDFFAEQVEKYFADKGKRNPKNADAFAVGYQVAGEGM